MRGTPVLNPPGASGFQIARGGGSVKVNADGTISIVGNTDITGTLLLTGNLTQTRAGFVTWTMENTDTGVAFSTRTMGILEVKGRDDADATVIFQNIVFNSADASAGAEDGTTLFRNMVAGTLTTGITLAGINATFAGTVAITGDIGFFGQAATAKPTGVAVTAAGIHAALVTLNLIAA